MLLRRSRRKFERLPDRLEARLVAHGIQQVIDLQCDQARIMQAQRFLEPFERLGFVVRPSTAYASAPAGTAVGTAPAAGTPAAPPSSISLTISAGPEPVVPTRPMPPGKAKDERHGKAKDKAPGKSHGKGKGKP